MPLAALLLVAFSAQPALAESPRATWRVPEARFVLSSEGAPAGFTLRVPRDPAPTLVTFEWADPPRTTRGARWRADTAAGDSAAWRLEERGTAMPGQLQRVVVDSANGDRRLRVRFFDRRVRGLHQLASFRLDPDGDNDIWLFVGASIQARSIRHGPMNALVQERFGRDPVILNRAVGGWSAANLRRRLPSLLQAHPWARYVAVHVGGNDVSAARPFPGGADRLRGELATILEAIRAAGRTPVLARLSYRAYRSDPSVPPSANGSGPYVEAVYDPLIARYCPDFYDPVDGRGTVDPYGWYARNSDELLPDGIHPSDDGKESFRRLWVDGAIARVYGSGGP